MVYGKEPPTLLAYIPGTAKVAAVEEELSHRDQVVPKLKKSIKEAQNRMKRVYDRRHTERVCSW